MVKSTITNNNKLLKLQKEYRNGLIREDDLSSEELEQLKELYKKQIDYIEDSIEKDKQEILNLKRKIGEM